MRTSPALRFGGARSLQSYNPIQAGSILYLPMWHPSMQAVNIRSADSYRHACIVTLGSGAFVADGFDNGADGSITLPNDTIFGLVTGTIIAVIKSMTLADAGYLFSNGSTSNELALHWDGTDSVDFYHDGALREAIPRKVSTSLFVCYAFTYIDAGGVVTGYKDGVSTGTGVTGAGAFTPGNPMVLASAGGGTNPDCIIHSFYMYDRVLTADEMAYHFNNIKGRLTFV